MNFRVDGKKLIQQGKETITRIEELCTDLSGLRIVTSEREIHMGISNDQNCCEQWGETYTTDITLSKYAGAKLLGIVETNETMGEDPDDEPEVKYRIETSVGNIVWGCWNIHDGYYSHRVIVTDVTNKKHLFWETL